MKKQAPRKILDAQTLMTAILATCNAKIDTHLSYYLSIKWQNVQVLHNLLRKWSI